MKFYSPKTRSAGYSRARILAFIIVALFAIDFIWRDASVLKKLANLRDNPSKSPAATVINEKTLESEPMPLFDTNLPPEMTGNSSNALTTNSLAYTNERPPFGSSPSRDNSGVPPLDRGPGYKGDAPVTFKPKNSGTNLNNAPAVPPSPTIPPASGRRIPLPIAIPD